MLNYYKNRKARNGKLVSVDSICKYFGFKGSTKQKIEFVNDTRNQLLEQGHELEPENRKIKRYKKRHGLI